VPTLSHQDPDGIVPGLSRAWNIAPMSRCVVWLVPFCLSLLSGCQTSGHSLAQATAAFDCGDTAEALEQLDYLAEQRGAEPDILALDRAMVQLLEAKPDATVAALETTRRQLSFLEQTDLSEHAHAALKDESSIAWSGREFERRMIDNLQVIASLLQNEDDAFALASRGMENVRQDQIELNRPHETPEPPETTAEAQALPTPARYSANSMTAWLAAAVHSERIQDADVTDRLIQQVAAWDPSGNTSSAALQTFGTHTARSSGTLQVITLSGRISPWESERAIPTTAALLVADRILSVTGKHTLPPTTSPVVVARPVHKTFSPRYRTLVTVGKQSNQTSRLLVDLNAAAWDSWQADRDQQLARAVVRRVVKKGTVYGAKNVLDISRGSGADLLLNLAGTIWESREKADLRQWNLLPAAVEVAQMELPAGQHTVTLEVHSTSVDTSTHPVDQLEIPVMIVDGRNTYVVCFRPQGKLIGVQSNR
jgi:hypothetical protein